MRGSCAAENLLCVCSDRWAAVQPSDGGGKIPLQLDPAHRSENVHRAVLFRNHTTRARA
eukprot:COSAG05_NODE_857_length_6940_cov_4.243385_2_plen_59_part_00